MSVNNAAEPFYPEAKSDCIDLNKFTQFTSGLLIRINTFSGY
jgi:hypothetical protein